MIIVFFNACALKEPEKMAEKRVDIETVGKEISKEHNEFVQKVKKLQHDTNVTASSEQRRTFIKKEKSSNYIFTKEKKSVKRISLEFENVELKYIIQMIAKVSKTNILMDDAVKGTISVSLKDVPWDKALDSILKMKGLGQYVDKDANIIRIHKTSDIVKLEEYDKKRIENLQKMEQLDTYVQPKQTEIFRIFYANPLDVKKQLEAILKKTAKNINGINIVEDIRLKSLIITASKNQLNLIEKLLDKLDIKTKQVLIEAIIVEVGSEYQRELGVRLGGNYDYNNKGTRIVNGVVAGGDNIMSNLSANNPNGAIGVLVGSNSGALKMELSAMQREGKSEVLSNPKVFTLDTKKAIFKQGTQIPVRGTAENGGTVTTYKDALLKLEVTPSIVGDGNIIMNISLSNDSLHPGSAEIIDAMSIDTQLLIQEGTIVVLGGIRKKNKSNSVDGVPGLSDMDVVGNMFKRQGVSNGTTELLIFLTTRIL
jgi:type IV pilus assembly protein PilQ